MKANEINGVETTSFLKTFVVLMYLFIFDFFSSILIKKRDSIAVKKLIEHRKTFSEKFISTLFSLNFFFLKLLLLPVLFLQVAVNC